MANDPYYKDVQVNLVALSSLPLVSTDISRWIPHVNSNDTLSHQQSLSSTVEPPNSFQPYEIESSSFISTQPNARTEVEEIRQLLHIANTPLAPSIDWPPLGISLSMSTTQKYFFPWLFQLCSPQVQQFLNNHAFMRLICTNMHFT